MPFVKVSRDKRGYEQISLVHVSARRGRPSKARVLYVFRTPPGIKIGREPFDEAIQRELEAQNPGVVFDWKMLSNIPPPAPDVEFWRERRKADKAAKLARKAEEQADAAEELDASERVAPDAAAAGLAAIEDLIREETLAADSGNHGLPIGDDDLEVVLTDLVLTDPTPEITVPGAIGHEGPPPAQRRRQRRGGRRRHRGSPPGATGTSQEQDTQRVQAEAPGSTGEGLLEISSGSGESEAGPSNLARDASKEA